MDHERICPVELIEKMAERMPLSLMSMGTAGDMMTAELSLSLESAGNLSLMEMQNH